LNIAALTESQAKHLRELLRSAAARREHNEFAIEGPHLLEAAIQKARGQIQRVAFTEDAISRNEELLRRCHSSGLPVYSIPKKLAMRISDTEEPQGIFAELQQPDYSKIVKDRQADNLIVALDAVQDPGNLGTIVRTAAWFGVKTILLGEGTADPYTPKVIRSTQGAIFDVILETRVDLARRIRQLKENGTCIIATTLDSTARSLYDIEVTQKSALLFGSEAHGLRPELLGLAANKIVIPRYGSGESLNVAMSVAIVLSEFRRCTSTI
jgi:RNA methyltransferase, TrmH family